MFKCTQIGLYDYNFSFLYFYSDNMKFLLTGSFLFVAFAVLVTAEEWSWGSNKKTEDSAKPSTTEPESIANRESKSIDSYSEINDDSSGSQEGGASVDGSSANSSDTHARHAIKDRLCGLGLMEVINTHIYVYSS